jgi:hypothetical protein
MCIESFEPGGERDGRSCQGGLPGAVKLPAALLAASALLAGGCCRLAFAAAAAASFLRSPHEQRRIAFKCATYRSLRNKASHRSTSRATEKRRSRCMQIWWSVRRHRTLIVGCRVPRAHHARTRAPDRKKQSCNFLMEGIDKSGGGQSSPHRIDQARELDASGGRGRSAPRRLGCRRLLPAKDERVAKQRTEMGARRAQRKASRSGGGGGGGGVEMVPARGAGLESRK